MLYFWRKIRRKLIEEGNLRRYFLYALGEILLVVVGILLALQINNWSEERKSAEKEEVVLRDLLKDLESNLAILQDDIRNNQTIINNAGFIIQHFENELPYSDSLSVFFPMLAWSSQLILVTSAFESLQSSGFDLIRPHDLKLEIIGLFDHEYHSAAQWINTIGIEKYKEFSAELAGFPRGGIAKNYATILTNNRLYNLLIIYKGWREAVVLREMQLIKETRKLKEEIRKELDR